MDLRVIQRILGFLLMVFSITLLPPIVVDLIYKEHHWHNFFMPLLLNLGIGFLIWYPARRNRNEIRVRDGFFISAMFWIVLSLVASTPFQLTPELNLSFTDAVFEATSGLTSTGASLISGLDTLPHGILYYRQQLNWLGGLGIVILAVAILPMLGVGGMQLYKTEMSGPSKDDKMAPRIAETAKGLWIIYLWLTAVCATAFWLGGMTPFDAIGYAFSVMSLGGFAPHDASMGYYNTPYLLAVGGFFMLIAGIQFTMHFIAWRTKGIVHYWRSPEVRFYLLIVTLSTCIIGITLWINHTFADIDEAFLTGFFNMISVMTTTGLTTTDLSVWPSFIPVLLIMLSFIGGSAGSTAGGIKVVRVLLLWKQGLRELHRLIHPNAIVPIKLGARTVPDSIITSVWAFFALYIFTAAFITLLFMA
ncbi:MAG: potassium transporter, partial [Proteobacteria bacterium]|nr:potassium transporter [Pseudomonadota bacterium]